MDTIQKIHFNDFFIVMSEVLGIGWSLIGWMSGAHWIWVALSVVFSTACIYLILSKYWEEPWLKQLKA